MNKKALFGLALFLGLSSQAFAGAGYANDGLVFTLVLIGVFMALAALLYGIDYLHKNGKTLYTRVKAYIGKQWNALDQLFKKVSSRLIDLPDF